MNHPDDTIVAIATPLGAGGLGVVRLSGPASLEIAGRLFSAATLRNAPSHTLHHGWIRDAGRLIDEAVVAVFRSPASYTGEDVVEFSCHGSPAVLKELMELCRAAGARPAGPGEFTQRAYLNGKMDLAQAEAVAELIQARSERQRAAAADQLRGVLSGRVRAVRTRLIELLAHLEANLDFVEEDIPGTSRERIQTDIETAAADVATLLSTSVRGRLIRDGIRAAIVGKPNVGKSSLFNALLAADRAIVTEIAGTTRDTLEEAVQWDGHAVVLTDTAGLRATTDPVEKLGTERAERAHRSADVVLAVVDGSAALDDADRSALRGLPPDKTVLVVNKADRTSVVSPAEAAKLGFGSGVRVSAQTAAGLTDLKERVLAAVRIDGAETDAAPVVTNFRHVALLEQAAVALAAARQALQENRSEEALAVDLRQAAAALGAITGEDLPDDVLRTIFSRFCIGK